MEKFSTRLKNAMRMNDITPINLSRKAGIPKSSISQYVNGKATPKADRIYISCPLHWMCQNHGCSGTMFRLKEIRKYKAQNVIYSDYFPLEYSTNLSAGGLDEPLDAETDAVVYVPIRYQNRVDDLHAFKVNGESMNNVIPNGATVVAERVDSISDLRDGAIVVAYVEGEATVKRIYKDGKTVTPTPDSSDKRMRPIVINTEIHPVYIIGKVIWFMNPDNIMKIVK